MIILIMRSSVTSLVAAALTRSISSVVTSASASRVSASSTSKIGTITLRPRTTSRISSAQDLDRSANDFAGAVSATFTLRYPFPCHQFSPFVVTGVGAYFGQDAKDNIDFDEDDNEFEFSRGDNDAHIGTHVGGGVEWRFTPSFSAISDFTWHWVEGHDNNFGMFKAGLNFAF